MVSDNSIQTLGGFSVNHGIAMVDRETPKGLDTNVTNLFICNPVCNVSAGSPYPVAGTSITHHMRLKIWRPKGILSPASGALENQC